MKEAMAKRLSKILSVTLRTVFTLLSLGLLYVLIFQKDWILQFLGFLERLTLSIGYWNLGLAFVLSVVESFPVLGAFFPGMQAMLLISGFFGRTHFAEMAAVVMVGTLVGNFVGYALGKRYGKGFFQEYGDIFGIGKTELRYLEKQIAKNGPWFVVFGKFHNFLRAFVPFVVGSGEMHPKRFWTYNFIGSAVWAGTMVTLGVAFASYYPVVVKFIGRIFLGIFVAVAIYIALFRREGFKAYLEAKRQEIEEKQRNG